MDDDLVTLDRDALIAEVTRLRAGSSGIAPGMSSAGATPNCGGALRVLNSQSIVHRLADACPHAVTAHRIFTHC
jgi:hypothetical protein